MRTKSTGDYLVIALFGLLSLYPITVAAFFRNTVGDDAFITLTYARSLAQQGHFYFHYPPASLGTTAPLFAMVLAMGIKLLPFIQPERLMLVVSALFWAGIPWLLLAFRNTFFLKKWQALLVGAVFAAGGMTSFLSMESNFYFFVVLLAIGLSGSGRYVYAGITAALLVLVRTEGIILLPLLAGWIVANALLLHDSWSVTARKLSWLLAGAALIWISWGVYSYLTIGQILPHTGVVKILQGQQAKRIFPTELPRYLFYHQGGFWQTHPWLYYLHYGLGVLGLVFVFLRRGPWLVLLAWIVVYITGFMVAKVAWYPWYATAVIYMLNLLAGLGLLVVAGGAARRARHLAIVMQGRRPIYATGIAVMFLLVYLSALAWPNVERAIYVDTSSHFPQRWRTYVQAADWLQKHTEPGTLLACRDVGYMGYYGNKRILDLMGLVTLEQLTWLRKGDTNGIFWHYLPEYCAFWMLWSKQDPVVRDQRFGKLYAPCTSFRIDAGIFTIYKRRPQTSGLPPNPNGQQSGATTISQE